MSYHRVMIPVCRVMFYSIIIPYYFKKEFPRKMRCYFLMRSKTCFSFSSPFQNVRREDDSICQIVSLAKFYYHLLLLDLIKSKKGGRVVLFYCYGAKKREMRREGGRCLSLFILRAPLVYYSKP